MGHWKKLADQRKRENFQIIQGWKLHDQKPKFYSFKNMNGWNKGMILYRENDMRKGSFLMSKWGLQDPLFYFLMVFEVIKAETLAQWSFSK